MDGSMEVQEPRNSTRAAHMKGGGAAKRDHRGLRSETFCLINNVFPFFVFPSQRRTPSADLTRRDAEITGRARGLALN